MRSSAPASERSLADHDAGRLVVDMEVAGGEVQHVGGLGDRRTILGDDGPGQRVRRGLRRLA